MKGVVLQNKLFSFKKDNYHYIVTFFGLKLKLVSVKSMSKELSKLQLQAKRSAIPTIYNTNLTLEQKEWYLANKFYEEVGYFPNLRNPKSFNEKINWMKLHYYNPKEKNIIDKYEFKNYIKEKLGSGYTIPLIGVYESVYDIEFDKLPNQFVVKTTTGGSSEAVEIIKDKNKINIDKLKYKFNNLAQEWNSIYYYCLSLGYKDIKPRIIIEKYIEQINGQVHDYKFFCFNGEPRWILACGNRNKNTIYENYDMNWNLFVPSPKSATKATISCPKSFNKMVEIAKKLSAPFPFVRVDFYEVNKKVYVGELTFSPGGGFNTYYKKWDYKVGQWLDLNKINQDHSNVLHK